MPAAIISCWMRGARATGGRHATVDMATADLAPIDLLIQRADRPWRHGEAEVVVAEPEPLMLIARA